MPFWSDRHYSGTSSSSPSPSSPSPSPSAACTIRRSGRASPSAGARAAARLNAAIAAFVALEAGGAGQSGAGQPGAVGNTAAARSVSPVRESAGRAVDGSEKKPGIVKEFEKAANGLNGGEVKK